MTRIAGWGRIPTNSSPGDMGSILKLGSGNNGKSHSASGGAGGAYKMFAGASGTSGFATLCIQPRWKL